MRWTPTRKARVCQLVLRGDLPRSMAAFLYDVPEAELLRWISTFQRLGEAGLSVTRKDTLTT